MLAQRSGTRACHRTHRSVTRPPPPSQLHCDQSRLASSPSRSPPLPTDSTLQSCVSTKHSIGMRVSFEIAWKSTAYLNRQTFPYRAMGKSNRLKQARKLRFRLASARLSGMDHVARNNRSPASRKPGSSRRESKRLASRFDYQTDARSSSSYSSSKSKSKSTNRPIAPLRTNTTPIG